jgi:hypothetical protein
MDNQQPEAVMGRHVYVCTRHQDDPTKMWEHAAVITHVEDDRPNHVDLHIFPNRYLLEGRMLVSVPRSPDGTAYLLHWRYPPRK